MKNTTTSEVIKKIYSKKKIKRFIELWLGALLVALSFNIFCLPNNLVSGGISGLSIITESLFNLTPSVVILVIDILLVVLSYFLLGKEKTFYSLIGSLLFPLFVQLTTPVTQYISLGEIPTLLATIFAGIIQGAGAGLIYKAGYTLGGTDIINQMLSKYFKMSLGNAMYFSDGIIILLSGIIFGLNKIMYGIILLYIISYITDKVIIGVSESKAFYIITKNPKEIKNYIINDLHHSVTEFKAEGGYSEKQEYVLMTVLPTKEYFKFKDGIMQIDNETFFVVTDAYEVVGGQ